MRLQMAHMRRPQCCLSGFCSVSKVTMVRDVVRGARSINYNSVLSCTVAGYTVIQRLAPHVLPVRVILGILVPHLEYLFHRRKRNEMTTTMARAQNTQDPFRRRGLLCDSYRKTRGLSMDGEKQLLSIHLSER